MVLFLDQQATQPFLYKSRAPKEHPQNCRRSCVKNLKTTVSYWEFFQFVVIFFSFGQKINSIEFRLLLDVGRDFRFLKKGLRLIIQFFGNLPNPIELIKDLIGVVEEEIVEIIKALVKDPKEFFLMLIDVVISNVRILVDDVMKFGRFVMTASAGKI